MIESEDRSNPNSSETLRLNPGCELKKGGYRTESVDGQLVTLTEYTLDINPDLLAEQHSDRLTAAEQAVLRKFKRVGVQLWSTHENSHTTAEQIQAGDIPLVLYLGGLSSNEEEWSRRGLSFPHKTAAPASRDTHRPTPLQAIISCPGAGQTELKDEVNCTVDDVSAPTYSTLVGAILKTTLIQDQVVCVGHSAGGEAALLIGTSKPEGKSIGVVALNPAVSLSESRLFLGIKVANTVSQIADRIKLIFREQIQTKITETLIGAHKGEGIDEVAQAAQTAMHALEMLRAAPFASKCYELIKPDQPQDLATLPVLPFIITSSDDILTPDDKQTAFVKTALIDQLATRQTKLAQNAPNRDRFKLAYADLLEAQITTLTGGHDLVFISHPANNIAVDMIRTQLERVQDAAQPEIRLAQQILQRIDAKKLPYALIPQIHSQSSEHRLASLLDDLRSLETALAWQLTERMVVEAVAAGRIKKMANQIDYEVDVSTAVDLIKEAILTHSNLDSATQARVIDPQGKINYIQLMRFISTALFEKNDPKLAHNHLSGWLAKNDQADLIENLQNFKLPIAALASAVMHYYANPENQNPENVLLIQGRDIGDLIAKGNGITEIIASVRDGVIPPLTIYVGPRELATLLTINL